MPRGFIVLSVNLKVDFIFKAIFKNELVILFDYSRLIAFLEAEGFARPDFWRSDRVNPLNDNP